MYDTLSVSYGTCLKARVLNDTSTKRLVWDVALRTAHLHSRLQVWITTQVLLAWQDIVRKLRNHIGKNKNHLAELVKLGIKLNLGNYSLLSRTKSDFFCCKFSKRSAAPPTNYWTGTRLVVFQNHSTRVWTPVLKT